VDGVPEVIFLWTNYHGYNIALIAHPLPILCHAQAARAVIVQTDIEKITLFQLAIFLTQTLNGLQSNALFPKSTTTKVIICPTLAGKVRHQGLIGII
jgi:hypothetical protein